MNLIYMHNLSIIALIGVFFAVFGTKAQGKMINGQNDSIRLNSKNHRSRGYFNVTSLEVLNFDFNYLKPVSLSPVPGISTINGYRFSRTISFGLGIGFDYIGVWLPVYAIPNGVRAVSYVYYYKEEMSFIPVFIDFRVNLSDTPFTPYVFVDAGYDISLNPNKTVFVDTRNFMLLEGVSSVLHKFSGGIYAALGFGLKFHLYKNIKLNTAIKFTYRRVNYYDEITNEYQWGMGGSFIPETFPDLVHNSLFLLGTEVGVSF